MTSKLTKPRLTLKRWKMGMKFQIFNNVQVFVLRTATFCAHFNFVIHVVCCFVLFFFGGGEVIVMCSRFCNFEGLVCVFNL